MTQEEIDSKWNELSNALETANDLSSELGFYGNAPSDHSVMVDVKSKYDRMKPFMDERFNTVRPVGWTPE